MGRSKCNAAHLVSISGWMRSELVECGAGQRVIAALMGHGRAIEQRPGPIAGKCQVRDSPRGQVGLNRSQRFPRTLDPEFLGQVDPA